MFEDLTRFIQTIKKIWNTWWGLLVSLVAVTYFYPTMVNTLFTDLKDEHGTVQKGTP